MIDIETFQITLKQEWNNLINHATEKNVDSNISKRKVVIPIEIDITIDGLSGLFPCDIFKIE